jgi:ABC-type long-subunit fatty acid transport system fused permease/ATPase subunit
MTRLWILLAVFAHSLDIGTTSLGLSLGVPEANPLMASLLHSHGELAMYVFKASLVGLVTGFVLLVRRRYPLAWPAWCAGTLLTLIVVVNNTVEVAKVIG